MWSQVSRISDQLKNSPGPRAKRRVRRVQSLDVAGIPEIGAEIGTRHQEWLT